MDTCKKKRRRTSDIGDSSSSQKVRRQSFDYLNEDDPLDEDGLPLNLRTVGKSGSFKEDDAVPMHLPYPSSQNIGLSS
jgi:hypothetical protein